MRVWDIVAVWRLRKFSLKNLENRYKAQKGNIVKHHLLFLFGVPWLALECIQFIVYFAILQFLQYIYIHMQASLRFVSSTGTSHQLRPVECATGPWHAPCLVEDSS